MHDAVLGFYEPSEADAEANICTGCFGTTINIYDGSQCGDQSNDAGLRADNFEDFCSEFGANCPTLNTECVEQGAFS